MCKLKYKIKKIFEYIVFVILYWEFWVKYFKYVEFECYRNIVIFRNK